MNRAQLLRSTAVLPAPNTPYPYRHRGEWVEDGAPLYYPSSLSGWPAAATLVEQQRAAWRLAAYLDQTTAHPSWLDTPAEREHPAEIISEIEAHA